MSDHLPECECYGRNHGGCALCICDRLRACEQRVRMEDDDYAYVAAQAEADGRRRGWSEALDAAWQAVAQECSTYPDLCGQCRANVYAIEALREQPADQPRYNLPDAR